METQYTKIDDKTMEVMTPTIELVTIDDLKRIKKEKADLKSQYLGFLEQIQGEIDQNDALLTQAESIGLVIE